MPWLSMLLIVVIATLSRPVYAKVPAQDSRSLTTEETTALLPLVCKGPTLYLPTPFNKYACQQLIGHDDTGIIQSANGLQMSLVSIIRGHLSAETAEEAYVTYTSNFEDHANGFGGGILFRLQNNRWTLVKWFPGRLRNDCLVLPDKVPAEAVCLGADSHSEGPESWVTRTTVLPDTEDQLETSLSIKEAVDISPPYDSCKDKDDLDLKWAFDPCSPASGSVSPVFLQLQDLKRSSEPGIFARLSVEYVSANDLEQACRSSCFIDARHSVGLLKFKIEDGRVEALIPPELKSISTASDQH